MNAHKIEACIDGLFPQVIEMLREEDEFKSAIESGEMTPEAERQIMLAISAVFDRNEKLSRIFISDEPSRKAVTRFHFQRAFAGARASAAYRDAFNSAKTARF